MQEPFGIHPQGVRVNKYIANYGRTSAIYIPYPSLLQQSLLYSPVALALPVGDCVHLC
jgi:hypothetical protein